MALTLIKTATKLAIGAGAVYLTVDQGVWSSQSESSQALSKVRTKVLPETNEYWQKVPSVGEATTKIADTWNSGVQATFSGLANVPRKATELSKSAVNELTTRVK